MLHISTCLIHHGVKNQKWGVRNGPPYPSRRKTASPAPGIEDPQTGDELHLVEGSRIMDRHVFAGKGSSTLLKEEVA